MKNKLFTFLAAAALTIFVSGCVATVDGHTRAAVPFIKDKIASRYERPVAQIVAAAKKVLEENGKLNSLDILNNSLTAKVDTRTIWIKVTEVDKTVSEVLVQVRKRNGGTDIDLASQLDKQIALQLNIATDTVKSHVRNVMDKLALHSRLQIAAYAHNQDA